MPDIVNTTGRVLEIDLTHRRITDFIITAQDRRLYLGGKGLALKYLAERLRPGVDALSADNVLVVMAGLLVGSSAPSSSRFAAAA